MTNTVAKMREILLNIYSCSSPKRYKELVDVLDNELTAAHGSLEKRRVYAKRIRMRLDWEELKELKIVPHIASEDDLIGPDEIIDVGVEYLWGSGLKKSNELKTDFDNYINELTKASKQVAKELVQEVDGWLGQTISERGRVRCYLRALFMRDQFELGKIVSNNYLPKEALEYTNNKNWWVNYKWGGKPV